MTGFQAALLVKNPPTEATESRVRSLDREDPLEEGIAAHSSVLSCRIPWTEEPGRAAVHGLQTVGHD